MHTNNKAPAVAVRVDPAFGFRGKMGGEGGAVPYPAMLVLGLKGRAAGGVVVTPSIYLFISIPLGKGGETLPCPLPIGDTCTT